MDERRRDDGRCSYGEGAPRSGGSDQACPSPCESRSATIAATRASRQNPSRRSEPMQVSPSASYSMTVRLEIRNRTGMLGKVTSALGRAGADIGAIDIVQMGPETVIRDITFNASDSKHGQQVVDALRHVAGVKVVHVSDRTFLMHLGGKIEEIGRAS